MVKKSTTMQHNTAKRKISDNQTGTEYWKQRGPEDVYYQRESSTTWWTVLGGVAVGALLTRLESIWTLVQSGDWQYLLYVVATALVILFSWLSMSWGALVLRMRISLAHTLYVYLSGLALSFVSLSVTNISIWWLTITILMVIFIFTQLYLSRSGAWVAFPEFWQRRILKGLWIYLFFIGLALAGFILINLYPIKPLEIGFGVVALLGSIVVLIQQDEGVKIERELLKIP